MRRSYFFSYLQPINGGLFLFARNAIQHAADVGVATFAAKAVAKQNGFVVGTNGVTAINIAAPVPGTTNELSVKIVGTSNTSFLRLLGFKSTSYSRSEAAEYLRPIQLGQPGVSQGATLSATVGDIGPPETDNGRRTLTPLPESIRKALQATPRTDEFIWPGYGGGLWDARHFWATWNAIRKKAKLHRPPLKRGDPPVRLRFHDLRHTVATQLLDKGVAPQTVAFVLGDTVQTVMNTYAHATARGLDTAMAAIDQD